MNDEKNIRGRPGSSATATSYQRDGYTNRPKLQETISKGYGRHSQTGPRLHGRITRPDYRVFLRRTIADPEWVGFVIAAPLIALLLTLFVLAVWPDYGP